MIATAKKKKLCDDRLGATVYSLISGRIFLPIKKDDDVGRG
jgi:hypothetical protein